MDIRTKDFPWEDIEDNSNEHQPGHDVASDIISCAECISEYVIDNINISKLVSAQSISIPIPSALCPILQSTRSTLYTDSSRSSVFDAIRLCFIGVADDEHYRNRLQQKIEQVITKNSKVQWVRLYDDPMTVATSSLELSDGKIISVGSTEVGGEIVVEIGLKC